jgi:hypothetical protein
VDLTEERLGDMGINIIAWVASLLFTVATSILAFRYLKSERASLNAVIYPFLWIFTVTLLVFVVGISQRLTPDFLLLVSVVGLILMGLFRPTREILLGVPQEMKSFITVFRGWWQEIPRWLQLLTIFALIISIVRFTFLILTLPPFVWDSLTYHLTNVAEWIQIGGIRTFETSIDRIYSPANFEVFTTWFTVFLHHDAIIEASGLPVYFLAIIAVNSIGRSLGYSRSAAWLGSLALATTPSILIAVTGTKNDPHMAAYILAALAVLIGLLNPVDRKAGQRPVGQLIVFILILSLAFGTKTYLLHLTPILALVGLDGIWGIRKERRWGEYKRKASEELAAWDHWVRVFIILMLISGAVLAFYWNARNWIEVGNPFYPYDVDIGGIEVIETEGQDFGIDFWRLEMNFKSLAWKFGDRRGRITPDLTDTTGWGWVVYGLGIPTLVWGLFKKRYLRVLTAGFFVSLTLIFFSTQPSPWNLRYILWFPAIFIFALIAYIDELPEKDKFIRNAFLSLAVLCMGSNFVSVWNYGNVQSEEFRRMLDYPVWERGSAEFGGSMPAEYANTLEIVPADVVLGYHVHSNGFVYPLYRPDYSQELAFIPIQDSSTCQDVAKSMEARGTRYLMVAPEHTSDEMLGFMHQCGEAEDYIRERSFNLYVLKDKD